MPLPGQGAVPTSTLCITDLGAATRRAFVPRLFVQIYFATPTLFYLLGAAQKSAGGLSQITLPIQGQSMVQGQFTGYGGGFAPPSLPLACKTRSSRRAGVVPVPLPFGETVIQATGWRDFAAEGADERRVERDRPERRRAALHEQHGELATAELVCRCVRQRDERGGVRRHQPHDSRQHVVEGAICSCGGFLHVGHGHGRDGRVHS